MSETGRRFWKMTGSGNDFVFFDARTEPAGLLEAPEAVGALCDRRNGIGADGVVFVEPDETLPFAIRYLNRDGSLAELCGNASLCAVSLARRLGIVENGIEFKFGTSSGPLAGRVGDGEPEIEAPEPAELQAELAMELEAGELRIGFARVGVPHVVVLCQDVEKVDVVGRGSFLRYHSSFPRGANANFISRHGTGWSMRTYERGVEEETLACGTGSVACATLLIRWGLAESPVRIRTRSGVDLTVLFDGAGASGRPRLRGEGRLVFAGTLADIPGVPR